MKKLIRSRSVLVVGKLCLLMLVLSLLCPTAPSYAALIESNGTGKYEITGKDTWGLIHPINGDDEVSSLTIIPGASLTLDVSHSNIYGNGNMIISGGGELIGQYGLDPSVTGGRGGASTIYALLNYVGLSNICYSEPKAEVMTSRGDFHPRGLIGKLLYLRLWSASCTAKSFNE